LREDKQILVLISSVFLIGIVGLFLTGGFGATNEEVAVKPSFSGGGDVYVEEYRADLYLNGTLKESFLYRIRKSGEYRMLYRNWKVPLTQEYIKQVSCGTF